MEEGKSTTAVADRDAEQEAPDIRGAGSHPSGAAAAAQVAREVPVADDKGKLSEDDEKVVVDAGEWLLEAFDERESEVVRPIELNVGSTAEPRWMPWVIKTVPGPDLRRIRARAADNIATARGPRATLSDTNTAARANAEIVVAGTKTPNLIQIAGSRGLADPTILVEEAFKQKPGLVDQVSSAIMELSGYDDAAMRDNMEVAAAGNSPG